MQDLVVIDSKNLKTGGILAAVVIAVLVFGWFSVRWQLGNLLATLTQTSDPNVTAIADLAIRLAPSDPSAYSLKAAAGEDPLNSVNALEQAVRRAPFDYRWRTELGRAYEQNGQIEQAEIQLKKAVELAPSYSSARWHLGNFYLRQEQEEKAIAELKIAAENNPIYRDQVFSLAWDYFDKDAGKIENLAGDRPDLRARLAYFFAARGRAEESLRNWNRLSDGDKAKNVVLARAIALGLYDQRHFPQSLDFLRQFGAENEAKPEAITNGSFETNIGETEDSRFGWQILRNDAKIDAMTDGKVKREGSRSLRVSFRSFIKPTLANIFQTVVVEPGKRYSLRFWVRTENLRSAGTPMIEIINANDDRSIARSPALATGTNDWQEMSIDFAAPPGCSGISIRTIRAFCGEECPITGILWYDDFELTER